jgi:hypothetical protein
MSDDAQAVVVEGAETLISALVSNFVYFEASFLTIESF